ncbi:MAG: amidase [Acidobacteriota bacterium]|nr:amidase [Acidobacteriota bacterium]
MSAGPLSRVTRAVREKEITALAVTEAALGALSDAADLNVLAELDAEGALRAARDLDEGHGGVPLAGAPTLVKDLEDWRGHPTRKGSRALADAAPAPSNSVVTQRLLDAGAIVLGKSTLPEFAIEGYTANDLTGVTRNPWNHELSPGGSSGGSGAALAAGLVGIATATDGGGSVRIPASMCGLLGLKPTNGVIGRWPAPDWIDYSTDGVLATSADDLALLAGVLVGPVAGDPTGVSPSALVSGSLAPSRLIAAARTSPLGPLEADVAARLSEAVAALGAHFDLEVTWMEPEEFFTGGDPDLDWFITTSAEHVAALGREWVVAHWDDFHVATREFFERGLATSLDDYLAARRRRYGYVRRVDELLGESAILLTPSVAASGWYADGRMEVGGEVHGLAPAALSTALQNITGHPALSVPFGRLANGLPFGIQLTAPRYHDLRLIELAAELEAAFPWRRCAPGYATLAERLGLE